MLEGAGRITLRRTAGEAERPSVSAGSLFGRSRTLGIPAGGLFTGAEGIKTAQKAAIFGETAGIAYDICYHQSCDTLANNNDQVLNEMSDRRGNFESE